MAERAPERCCTEQEALEWLDLIADEALSGVRLSRRMLPGVVVHWLRMRS